MQTTRILKFWHGVMASFAAFCMFACLGAATLLNTNQVVNFITGGTLRTVAQRSLDHISVLDYDLNACDGTDHHAAIQACINAAWECELPGGLTCNHGTTTINIPTGHSFLGKGMRASTLRWNGTGGGCGITLDNNDGGGGNHMQFVTDNAVTGSPGTRGVCLTNAVGPTLRGSFEDVAIISASPATPPVTGSYGLYFNSTTTNSLYYWDFRHLVTIGWDRGIEAHGVAGQGGVNANWFHGYSSNANVTGFFFDGMASDNYVQGHCNAGGTSFAQKCAIVGDNSTVLAGNEIHFVTDQGAGNGGITVQTNANSNMIVEFDEGGGTDAAGNSTNVYFDFGQTVNSRNVLLPNVTASSINTIGAQGTSSQLFIGGGIHATTEQHKVNVDYTILGGDLFVGMSGLTATHTLTLPSGQSGQILFIYDEDGSATGVHSLVIAAPATGIVNGAATITLTTAGAREICQATVANGLKWMCVGT